MPDGGDGFTNKEILLRVEEKLDKITDDHEGRIRSLERWRWSFPVGILGIAGTFFVALHGGPTP